MVSEPGSLGSLGSTLFIHTPNGETPNLTQGFAALIAAPSPVMRSLMLSRRQSASDRPAPYCAYCASSWNTSTPDG